MAEVYTKRPGFPRELKDENVVSNDTDVEGPVNPGSVVIVSPSTD